VRNPIHVTCGIIYKLAGFVKLLWSRPRNAESVIVRKTRNPSNWPMRDRVVGKCGRDADLSGPIPPNFRIADHPAGAHFPKPGFPQIIGPER
jgi:hypothetical protein